MISPSNGHDMHGARASAPLLRLLALSILALSAPTCGSDDGGGDVWRFAIEEAAGSVQDTYAQEFKKRIEQRSGGTVEVKVYPYGALGTSDDLTEQLRMGSLQFAMASPGHLGKSIPELQMFLLHYIFSDDDDVNLKALNDPEFRASIQGLFPEKGMELLAIIPEGWMVWTAKKEIRTPQDFEGVKIRTMTSPLLLATYEAYGASPQAMPYGEVYSALQLNMIDAQVNPVFAIEEMSFYEVTSHMIFANPAPFVTTMVTNADFVGGLDPEQRDLIEEVVEELGPLVHTEQRRMNAERLDRIRDRKPEMMIIELGDDERRRFRTRTTAVRARFREQVGARGNQALDALLNAIERARATPRTRGPK